MAAIDDISISFSRPELNPDVSVVSVRGFVDTTTSGELEESLKRLQKQGQYNIVVDLGGVNYISSAGWGIFISEIKEIRQNGGDLKLAGMIGEVYEVFELLEFQTILESYDTVDEAVESYGSAPGNSDRNEEDSGEGAEVKSTNNS